MSDIDRADNDLLRGIIERLREERTHLLAELVVVTEERDAALLDRDRLEHRLLIAHGEGDRQ
jgi:hypothetical protein